MSQEEFPKADQGDPQLIKLTEAEISEATESGVESPKLHDWMAEKGIEFDKGQIEVEIDGQKKKLQTDKNDFGTIIDIEQE